MRISILTDNTGTGTELISAVNNVIPDAVIEIVTKADKLLGYADLVLPDMILVDTSTTGTDTIPEAAEIRSRMPDAYIVFIADDGRYAVDAFRLHVRGYIVRPVNEKLIREEYENYLLNEERRSRAAAGEAARGLSIRNDGRFELYRDGEPVRFARNKTKKMLKYLVDHDGMMISDAEILSVLWANATASNKSYLRTLKSELAGIFSSAGCGDAIIKHRGEIGIMTSRMHRPASL